MTSPAIELAAQKLPPNSCDCHVHIIGPTEQFPLSKYRAYTPMEANVAMLHKMAKSASIDRHVLVQPSVYGTDNRCLLASLDTLGKKHARGVVVVDKSIGQSEIDHLQRSGVRGLRLNLKSNGTPNYQTIEAAIASAVKIAERYNWHIQLFMPLGVLCNLTNKLLALPVPIVLDHFGLLSPHQKDEATFSTIRKLLESGNCWVKLSGTYRIAKTPTHPDLRKLARQLFAINGDRCVWASDWPHTPKHSGKANQDLVEKPYQSIDTVGLIRDALGWLSPEDSVRLFRDNPKTLYDFED